MKNNLPNNIRAFRKERGLTQEQLAEVFNVTVGAVHKWEAGLSTPDLSILMEMADFFDISMDVLIGYDVKDNRIEVLAQRLRRMTDTMDPQGPDEASKAIKKYPNSFRIIYECAYLYRSYAAMFKINEEYVEKSIELYEQAIRLVPQNYDPNIDETQLYGQLAQTYQLKGDIEKSLEIYKAHNAGYLFNLHIGSVLVSLGKYEEAEDYLSYALVHQIGTRINLIINKALCYCGNGNYGEARAILEMGLKENELLKRNDKVSYLDRITCIYLTGLAYIEVMCNNEKAALSHLKEAEKKARIFDANPDFDARNERFVDIKDPFMAYDTTGETCIQGIENTIKQLKSKELLKLWKSIK